MVSCIEEEGLGLEASRMRAPNVKVSVTGLIILYVVCEHPASTDTVWFWPQWESNSPAGSFMRLEVESQEDMLLVTSLVFQQNDVPPFSLTVFLLGLLLGIGH